jgi:hypothetical protein
MAQFYPYLGGEIVPFPELASNEYRIASYVGAPGFHQMIPGPALDSTRMDDIHAILLLLGVSLDALQPISSSDGRAKGGLWLSLDSIMAITELIVFAVEDPAAQNFLLDLKAASEMIAGLFPASGDGAAGCMLHLTSPFSTHS